MLRYALAALALASVSMGGLLYHETKRSSDLALTVGTLRGELTVAQAQMDQARLAAEVAQANADRTAERAAEYDALRETLLKGSNDAPLPGWFSDYLRDLGIGRLHTGHGDGD